MGILYAFFISFSGFLVARAIHFDEVDNLTVLNAFFGGFWVAAALARWANKMGVKL